MKKVLAFGSFDILHYGHLSFLRRCRALGDRLVVIVARDETIRKLKKREPFFDEKARLEMVRALRFVDEAYLGYPNWERDRFKVIRDHRPAVIALGYDQKESVRLIGKKLRELGMSAKVVRIRHIENKEIYKSSKALARLRRCVLRDL